MDRKVVGTASKLPPLPHAISEQAGQDRLSVLDCRIECLMVLAQTLLREIEILREQSGTLRFTNANLPAEVHRFEAELLRTALIRTRGRQRRAARLLGMKVTTLNSKIKRYQINLEELSSIWR